MSDSQEQPQASPDRFSLLLLEEGEYYFRDYNSHFHKTSDQQCVPPVQLAGSPRCSHPDRLQGGRAPQGGQRIALLRAQAAAGAHPAHPLPAGLLHLQVRLTWMPLTHTRVPAAQASARPCAALGSQLWQREGVASSASTSKACSQRQLRYGGEILSCGLQLTRAQRVAGRAQADAGLLQGRGHEHNRGGHLCDLSLGVRGSGGKQSVRALREAPSACQPWLLSITGAALARSLLTETTSAAAVTTEDRLHLLSWSSSIRNCLGWQGELTFTFSLVYTSTEEVLPQLERLLAVARLDDSKEGVQQAAQRLSTIIQVRSVASWLPASFRRQFGAPAGRCAAGQLQGGRPAGRAAPGRHDSGPAASAKTRCAGA